MDAEQQIKQLEQRIAALEEQVQAQRKDFDFPKFIETLNNNLPKYLIGNVDTREGSTINTILKAITCTFQQVSRGL